MFTKILVGTDGSKDALEAVRVAGDLAKTMGHTEVHVITAAVPYSGSEMAAVRAALPEEFHDLVSPHLRAMDRFQESSAVLTPLGLHPVNHDKLGRAADAILDVAAEIEADLIVVGARGLGAVGRFFRGSVSTKVAHHSPCSVLIVEHN